MLSDKVDVPARNGGVRLPIGFRFRPTDEELLLHYLNRKVCSLPLPAAVIPDLDVFQTHPWDLPGDSREARYFFNYRKGNVGKYNNIRAGSGYWKTNGRCNPILFPGSTLAIGLKRSLAFYQLGKPSHGRRTDWIMHEFYLVDPVTMPCSNQNFMMPVGDWVVCRIHQKKRKAKNCGVNSAGGSNIRQTRGREAIRNLMMEKGNNDLVPPQPSSSSCSSGITDGELDEEASSYSFSSRFCGS